MITIYSVFYSNPTKNQWNITPILVAYCSIFCLLLSWLSRAKSFLTVFQLSFL